MVSRRILGGLGAALALIGILGAVAPFLDADRYRERIERSLSAALRRRVTVGEVRLNLFTGPGFEVRDVLIGDDPAVGSEPFAYVGDLNALPRIWSLWAGHLEFSSLVLSDAHLNLARSERADGTASWNFEPLLRPGLLAAFPGVHIRDSRVNFKLDGRKNTFYLLHADLDITPHKRDGTEWDLRFRGEPARTDRPARGFGALEARGRWTEKTGTAGNLELDLRLERSEIGDMVALVHGYDAGVHGAVSGRVHVAGALDALGVEGDLRVSELHGWDQSPPPGGVFAFRVSGTANSGGQRLEVFAAPRAQPATITAHLLVEGYLRQPRWRFETQSDALPVASIPSLLRNFGAAVPEGLRLEGTMQGGIRYSDGEGWKGEAVIRDAAIAIRDTTPLHFAEASLELADGTARIRPVEILAGANDIGTVGGEYELKSGSFHVRVASGGGPLSDLLQGFPFAAIPLLSSLQSGEWQGELDFTKPFALPGKWSGTGILTNATASVPALVQPVRILGARVRIDDETLQMDRLHLRAGDLEADGEYRYVPGMARPHQFRFTVDEAEAGELETLFQPVLQRRANLFDMALSLGRSSMPGWLRSMHAEGAIQVNSLRAAGHELKRVRTRMQWDGAVVSLSGLQAKVETASVAGEMAISVAAAKPRYLGTVKATGVEWQNGMLNGTFHVESAGVGLELLTNLTVEGTFDGRNVELDPIGAVEQLSGEGRIWWAGSAPRFRIPQLRLMVGGETWTGSGEPGNASGNLSVHLASQGKLMSLEGSVTNPTRAWVAKPTEE